MRRDHINEHLRSCKGTLEPNANQHQTTSCRGRPQSTSDHGMSDVDVGRIERRSVPELAVPPSRLRGLAFPAAPGREDLLPSTIAMPCPLLSDHSSMNYARWEWAAAHPRENPRLQTSAHMSPARPTLTAAPFAPDRLLHTRQQPLGSGNGSDHGSSASSGFPAAIPNPGWGRLDLDSGSDVPWDESFDEFIDGNIDFSEPE